MPASHVIDSQSPHGVVPPADFEPPEGAAPPNEQLPEYGFVALSKLREFFVAFRVCCPHHGCNQQFGEPRIKVLHQTWSLSFRCAHGHRYGWISTEMELYHSIPDITHRQYHVALSAGLGYTQLNGMCIEMGLARVSEDHFFVFQCRRDRRVGRIQATLDMWAIMKDEAQAAVITRNLHDLNGDPIGGGLVLYADLRYDSTRNGYNGTAVWIDGFDNRVVELVNMTRVEAGNNSWRIEDQAFGLGMQRLVARGMCPDEIVHDDKSSVDIEEAEVYEDLELFTVRQLEDWLRVRGARVVGNKPALIQHIAELRALRAGEGVAQVGSRRYMYPELRSHGIVDKLKGWIYTCCQRHAARTKGPNGRFLPENADCTTLISDIRNAADHWAGVHSICRELPGERPCCDLNTPASDHYFAEGSPTHEKLRVFLEKQITSSKVRFYTRARENFVNETFNSVINKYATKRTHYHRSHEARLGCCAMDWNKNITREPIRIYERRPQHTTIRNRTATRRVLPQWTVHWKTQLCDALFGAHRGD
ncbi:hypothetical protein R1sor_017877 [Riccia sorocarpa]|uniref:SAP domain-containing protein n=1 Tax=Riccia sorocarpa TaxID=122646 RepID=A0ABD3I822_9MARC